jgi:hypothetical protein
MCTRKELRILENKHNLIPTERYYYDYENCGILVDVFERKGMWHAIAIAESSEWKLQNGFGGNKEEAIDKAVKSLISEL